MANTKISNLIPQTTMLDTDLLVTAQDNVSNKKITWANFKIASRLASNIFPASAIPSADPNTLDDYEEGTFTPFLDFGSAHVGQTFMTQTGNYTKIGNLITCSIYLRLSAKGSSIGNATIETLPFTVLTSVGVPLAYNIVSFANQFMGYAEVTNITLQEITEGGTVSNLTEGNFSNTSRIYCSVTYLI